MNIFGQVEIVPQELFGGYSLSPFSGAIERAIFRFIYTNLKKFKHINSLISKEKTNESLIASLKYLLSNLSSILTFPEWAVNIGNSNLYVNLGRKFHLRT